MKNKNLILKLVTTALLCGIAVLLQAFGGIFVMPVTGTALALSFIPIAVGAILYGPLYGGLIGFVWSIFIIFSGQASYYMGMNAFGTYVTVISKGTLAGVFAGLVYVLLRKKSNIVAMVLAAIVAPLVNSLVYRIGLLTFFQEYFFGKVDESGMSAMGYFMSGFLGVSFIVELGISAVFSPIVARICKIGRKMLNLDDDLDKVEQKEEALLDNQE